MSSDLTSWVHARLEHDEELSEDAKLLILAALDGPDALADMAGFTPPARVARTVEPAEPSGAFIKQVKVAGFRGIGPEATLDLDPSPGLTVISGRNGSGKSSFAEAIEVALTGDTYRWKNKAIQWKDAWRNVHDGHPASIRVTIAEEGFGPTTIAVDWDADAELDAMAVSLQRRGEKKQPGLDALGWAEPLETHRPMLSYDELGDVMNRGPSGLYDALSGVLGLEQLTAAVKGLGAHHKDLGVAAAQLTKDKKALTQALTTLDDERASLALTLLRSRTTDVPALRQLATGTAEEGVGARIRAISDLMVPDAEECATAAQELTAAVANLAGIAAQIGETVQRRSNLLTAAITFHEHAGNQPCPVCAQGILDDSRVSILQDELARNTDDLGRLRGADDRRAAAERAARSLVVGVPAAMNVPVPDALVPRLSDLRAAWQLWADAPADDLGLAGHLTAASAPVREALEVFRTAAAEHLGGLDEAWSPIAAQLGAYANLAAVVAERAAEVALAKEAHSWLKDRELDLKNERLAPIAEAARAIWGGLRQESNVEISGLTLEGTATRRRVEIAAAVDGEDVGALSVMSQGELHALALALFLPRATMPQSPFRFVILDDPVQAMDPAKVDGLVKVLLDLAATRQVIVFSHDDRLAAALRRAPHGVPVKVLEVRRRANSHVVATVNYSPTQRYLRDGFAVAKDEDLPAETRRRIVPGLIRLALEAQAREIFFGRELSRGASPADVEDQWQENHSTRSRLGLALGDSTKLDGWLGKHDHRRLALRHANDIHQGLQYGDATMACRHAERTVENLKDTPR